MKKFKLHISYLLIILPTFASASIVQHDNIVCAKSGKQHVEMTVEEYFSHTITDGQPFDVNIENIKKGDNAGCINIRAGRKGSKDNVSWVKKKLGEEFKKDDPEQNDKAWIWQNVAVSNPMSFTASYPMPDKLNFAVKLTLKFKFQYGTTYTCERVIIGQGNHMSKNIWWLFTNTNNISQPIDFFYYRLLSCYAIDKYGNEDDLPLGIVQDHVPGRPTDKFGNSYFQVLPQEKL